MIAATLHLVPVPMVIGLTLYVVMLLSPLPWPLARKGVISYPLMALQAA